MVSICLFRCLYFATSTVLNVQTIKYLVVGGRIILKLVLKK